MQTLLLIDTHALLHRFFHAIPPLSTPSGKPIQAIYGLAGVLLKLFQEEKPAFVAAAFDTPAKTFREKKFAAYKAQRPPTASDLISQLATASEVFTAFKIKTFSAPGYEADDVIGTLATHFSKEPDLSTEIISGDLDLLQLVVDDRIVERITKTGLSNIEIYNETKVRERYGLPPSALPDYKGLVGDTSDNIPGVKGIGGKTARELLEEFGSLEGIFENLVIINPSVVKKLSSARDIAFISRELATIKRDVPFPLPSLQELATQELDTAYLKTYFASLGFMSLITRLSR